MRLASCLLLLGFLFVLIVIGHVIACMVFEDVLFIVIGTCPVPRL